MKSRPDNTKAANWLPATQYKHSSHHPPPLNPQQKQNNKTKNAQKRKSKTSSGVVHGYFSWSFCFKPRRCRPTWHSTAAGHASRLVCSGSLCDIKVTPCNAVQLQATCKCRRTGAVPSPVPWGTVAANHRADWQSAQAYSMVACTYVAPWTDVWDWSTCTEREKSFERTPPRMLWSEQLPLLMGLSLKLLVKVHLHQKTPVAWALSLMCIKKPL